MRHTAMAAAVRPYLTKPRPPARAGATHLANRIAVCLPHAGGAASAYLSWGRRCDPSLDWAVVQLPGRETRYNEPPPQSLTQVVDDLAVEITADVTLPITLYGHSMGAHLAVALAFRLRGCGAPLRGLVLSGSAPTWAKANRERIAHLPDDQFVEALRSFGSLPVAIESHPEILELYLPQLRLDLALTESWDDDRSHVLDRPMIVLGGDADARVPAEELTGWRDHTTGEVRVQTLSGGHFFIQEHVGTVLEAIEEMSNACAATERP